jgi:hypothetical protein
MQGNGAHVSSLLIGHGALFDSVLAHLYGCMQPSNQVVLFQIFVQNEYCLKHVSHGTSGV